MSLSPLKTYLLKVAELPDPHAALDAILDECTVQELAALYYDWRGWWARPEQILPDGEWSSWGSLTGRGWGKTRAIAEYVTQEVQAGRATRIALVAQKEDDCKQVMIHGPSGLIEVSPPWFRARFECGRVVWPNGAQAFIYTPEVPDGIYGHEHDMAWISEIHAWPHTTMEAAFANVEMGLRIGYARMVWDTNPRAKHPIIRELLEQGKDAPEDHVVVRGTTFENLDNLNKKAVAKWQKKYGGTQRGREMLLGEQFDDEDGAKFKQAWLDGARRPLPAKLKRKILIVDPAISLRKGTDATGIMLMGLGFDGRIYVIEDYSGKYAWEAWGDLVLEEYERHKCDAIIIERNRGGDACVANLRARAESRNRIESNRTLQVQKVDNDAITRWVPGTCFVKEVIGRHGKVIRAEPVASLAELGLISHVKVFKDLEYQLTTYEGDVGQQSPNNYDAYVYGAWELGELARDTVQEQIHTEATKELVKMITKPKRSNISALFSGGSGGRSSL